MLRSHFRDLLRMSKKKPKKKGHAGDVERESDGSRPVEADGPRTKQPDAPEYEAERTLPAHCHGKAKKKKCRDAKSARPAVVVAPPLETARTDAMPQNVTNDTPMSRPKTRIITKMAPAQCGIDEMTTTSACKEERIDAYACVFYIHMCMCVCASKSLSPAVVVAPPSETARTDAVPRNVMIAKKAPAQYGIAEMTTTSGCKEEKKTRKKMNKKGWQERHETERKPLEAERALRTMWDSEPEYTAEHACAVLAKLIACRHLTPSAFAHCCLVEDICKRLQTHKTVQLKHKVDAADGGCKVQASNVGVECPAPEPAAQRCSLTGGSVEALLLLPLTCCAALGIWLSSDVTTSPSSFDSSPLPTLSHHQLPHHVNTSRHPWALEPLTPCREFALGTIVSHHHVNTSRHHWALEPPTPHCEFAVGTIVSHHHVNTSLHHWALAPPTPRCEFAVGTSSPYVTSYASHQHAQEASFSPKVFFLYVECVSLPPLPVPNTHDVATCTNCQRRCSNRPCRHVFVHRDLVVCKGHISGIDSTCPGSVDDDSISIGMQTYRYASLAYKISHQILLIVP